jgi:hypothetical protein
VSDAEIDRDNDVDDDSCSAMGGRIVETWHIGNLTWALFRRKTNDGAVDDESLSPEDITNDIVRRTNSAIARELPRKNVLLVHLRISPEDSVRRRRTNTENAQRSPMEDECDECIQLHRALGVDLEEYLISVKNELGIPLLIVENSTDDDVDGTSRRIVYFINQHKWRRSIGNKSTRFRHCHTGEHITRQAY